MTDDKKPDQSDRTQEGTSTLEWVAAAVGAVLFVAMIGYMAYIGLKAPDGTPRIEVSSSPPVHEDGIYVVEFHATNVGTSTASAVVIRATLSRGGQEVETAEVTIDYLPTQSERSGGFFFRNDPAAHELELAAIGYVDP